MGLELLSGCYFSFLISRHLALNLFPFLLSSAQRVGMCYNNKGCAASAFLFLMQRQYNGATIHACAKKGSAECGKKSTKILKVYILALRVPGASLQAQRGDIAHMGTVHTWGSAQLGTLHTWDSAHVGTAHTWGQCARGDKVGKCYDGNNSKKGSATCKT